MEWNFLYGLTILFLIPFHTGMEQLRRNMNDQIPDVCVCVCPCVRVSVRGQNCGARVSAKTTEPILMKFQGKDKGSVVMLPDHSNGDLDRRSRSRTHSVTKPSEDKYLRNHLTDRAQTLQTYCIYLPLAKWCRGTAPRSGMAREAALQNGSNFFKLLAELDPNLLCRIV